VHVAPREPRDRGSPRVGAQDDDRAVRARKEPLHARDRCEPLGARLGVHTPDRSLGDEGNRTAVELLEEARSLGAESRSGQLTPLAPGRSEPDALARPHPKIGTSVPDRRSRDDERLLAGPLHFIDPLTLDAVQPPRITGALPHQDLPSRSGRDALHVASDRLPRPRPKRDAVVSKQASAGGDPQEPAGVLRDRVDFRERQSALEVELPLKSLETGGVGGSQPRQEQERRRDARAPSPTPLRARHAVSVLRRGNRR